MAPIPFHLIQVFGNPSLGFTGNTSTVVFLQNELEDSVMQGIAADQLQPATTFLWKAENDGEYHVRWFAPDAEIGLCGHGSMAALAYLQSEKAEKEITLIYRTDSLKVTAKGNSTGEIITQQIPVLAEEQAPKAIQDGLGIPILGFYATANKHIILTDSENTVRNMKPNFSKLRESDIFGYAITAPGDTVNFVSRTLVPHVHQLEDPATGSSHAALFPFWGKKLGKTQMKAWQLSARGGSFEGLLYNEKVSLTGHMQTLAKGEIL